LLLLLLFVQGTLDWLAFSVDASNDDLHAAMGRGLRGEVSAAMTAAASKPAADSRPSTATNAPDPANSSCGGTNDILVAGAASAAGGTDGVYKEQQQQRPRGHLARVRQLWGLAQEMGFRLKLNTVVTSVNL
jgi:radical S-adenosyl methionine domain-containing protein 2